MKLFFRKYGSWPPLFSLHGLYGSSDNWVTIAKNLGSRFTVYLPDARNHGHSPHSDEHDYDLMARDIYELTRELKTDKFFLAGHSMGGKTAISFAIRWPEKISGLLVADISPFTSGKEYQLFYDQHNTILNAIISVDLKSVRSRTGAEMMLSQKIASEKIRGVIMKNLERETENTFRWKINAPALLKNLENIMSGVAPSASSAYTTTGFPVIFLRGEESGYIPENDLADIKMLFPAAEIINVPGAGHWIHADRPDVVMANLLKLAE